MAEKIFYGQSAFTMYDNAAESGSQLDIFNELQADFEEVPPLLPGSKKAFRLNAPGAAADFQVTKTTAAVTVPAAGGVAVPLQNANFIQVGATPVSVTMSGISGLLSRPNAGDPIFDRQSAGPVTVVPAGTTLSTDGSADAAMRVLGIDKRLETLDDAARANIEWTNVSAFVMPATTTPVSVAPGNPSFLRLGGSLAIQIKTVTGGIVAGVLARDNAGAYTFTRSVAGTSSNVLAGAVLAANGTSGAVNELLSDWRFTTPSGVTAPPAAFGLFKRFAAQGSIRYLLADPTPQDDARGFYSTVLDVLANAVIGALSVAFGRNNLVSAYLGFAIGHDNKVDGVAGFAGGAGSNARGNLTFVWGRYNRAVAANSAAFGQRSETFGDNGFAAGRIAISGPRLPSHATVVPGTPASYPTAITLGNSTDAEFANKTDDGLGAFAAGDEAAAFGNGAVALGQYVRSYNGAVHLGRGANSGSPSHALANGVWISTGGVRPNIGFLPTNGAGYGKFVVNGETTVADSVAEILGQSGDKVRLRIKPGTGAGTENIGLILAGTNGAGSSHFDLFEIRSTSTNGGASVGRTDFIRNGDTANPLFTVQTDGVIDFFRPGTQTRTMQLRANGDVKFFGTIFRANDTVV